MCTYIDRSMSELKSLIETCGLESWDRLEQITWFCPSCSMVAYISYSLIYVVLMDLIRTNSGDLKFLNNRTTSLCHHSSCSLIIFKNRVTDI